MLKDKISFCALTSCTDVSSLFPEISRQQLKKSLSKKEIEKNIMVKDEIALPIDLVNHGLISPEYQGIPPEIVDESNLFLVLNKPPQVFSHPLTYSENDNLLSFMRSLNRGKLLDVNMTSYDRGLLYRLDFVTSGVIIYCKNFELYQKLRDHFSDYAIKKSYYAVVKGYFNIEGEVTQWFLHKGRKNQEVHVYDRAKEGAFKGIMTLLPKEYDEKNDLSLIQIDLKSGLRHQIRAGLAKLGYPILGDLQYGGEEANRVFLHAFEYQIKIENQGKTEIKSFKAYNTFGFEKLGLTLLP